MPATMEDKLRITTPSVHNHPPDPIACGCTELSQQQQEFSFHSLITSMQADEMLQY